jgi:hypothetical protein
LPAKHVSDFSFFCFCVPRTAFWIVRVVVVEDDFVVRDMPQGVCGKVNKHWGVGMLLILFFWLIFEFMGVIICELHFSKLYDLCEYADGEVLR